MVASIARHLCRTPLAILLSLFCLNGAAVAADFPERPIRLVVPWSVGGSTDVLGRIVAEQMAKQSGQSIVVENRPGATGTIGTNSVVRAKGDGYTTLLGTNSTFGIAPYLYDDLPYNHVEDLQAVGFIASNQQILVVHPNVPVNSLDEFIDYARKNPGKLNFASSGKGGSSHLAMELLMSMAGVELTHVPYKGGAPALQSVLSNETDTAFVDVTTVVPLIEGKNVRALGSSGTQRAPGLPNVPTIDEAGLSGFASQTSFGLFVPKGTPVAVVGQLNELINSSIQDAETAAKLRNLGYEMNPGTPEDFSSYVNQESEKWGRLIRQRNIRIE